MNKIIVSQIGSRRRYMIPQILHANGILECLYTDSNSTSFVGIILRLLKTIGFSNQETERLLRRETKIPRSKTYSNDWLQIKLLWHKFLRSPSIKFKKLRFEGSSRWFIRRGCKDASILYNMFIENFDYVLYAKSRGLKIICDIYENPYIFKELATDINEIPEYSCVSQKVQENLESNELRMTYIDRMLEIADAYLIPSTYVAESLKRSPYFNPDKVNIIPYASSIENKQYVNIPTQGRIIWIGSDPVRKGLVYCQRAARLLREKFSYVDFRIIGSIDKEIVESPNFASLNFIGRLDKEQLKNEFKKADMLVFPTLAEGFSGALLEAASYGVPVITTHASGFDDDFPGVFIKTRDTDDIVRAVTNLLENRNQRNQISHDLFEYSQNIDKNAFETKLIELINKL